MSLPSESVIDAAQLMIDAARLQAEIDHLAGFSSTPGPGVTRILFTDTDIAGRAYVKALMRDAGLEVFDDPAGNIFGRWAGSGSDPARIGTGSHCDAIPHAGRYDGTVGVLGGIAAVRALRAAGYVPRRSIDIIMFTSEEPTRFGIGCSGSRLLSSSLSPAEVAGLVDEQGISFDAARAIAGCSGRLEDVPLGTADYAAFVELHVEQGPVLERESLAIGVVTAIAAPASFVVTFRGAGGHAGTVLMPDRFDALVPAAALVCRAEQLARESGSPDTVATAGKLDVHPGAINSIPREVSVSFDVRDTDGQVRDRVVRDIRAFAAELAQERKLELHIRDINADPPQHADARIVSAVEQACARAALSHRRLVSRAYHDALFMARIAPMGMIFVPSKAGISHRPDEYTSMQEMANGVRVLADVLASLAA